ncbi:MAG: fibronectin type III domain-containing protein [Actinobacteria bacterium]|nr:fibronectin type III domain-containing protein [Actinomycetota bacterium]
MAPSAPTITSATGGDTTFTFAWSPGSPDQGHYQIWWGTDPTWASAYSYTSTSATSYTATGLTNGATYYARVANRDSTNTSTITPFSSNGSAVVAATPSAPSTVSPTAGNSQVSLTWSLPGSDGGASITDYRVQYCTAGTCTTFVDGVSTSRSATVTGLTNGTAYTFRVAGINSSGVGSYSTESASSTPSNPPTITSVVAGSNQLTWSWTAGSPSNNLWQVWWGTDATFATAYSYTSTGSMSYTATGLVAGTTYYVRVAERNSGNSANITGYSTYSSGVPTS